MKREVLIIIGVALVAAVGIVIFLSNRRTVPDTSSLAAANTQASVAAVPFTEITRGQNSVVTERVNYLITSTDELRRLWKMISTTSTPPVVDFEKQTVVAVFAGQQPTTGYTISISEVEDTDARKVSITLAKPDGSCMTGQALTAPYEIVVVPATSLPFTHEDAWTTTSCK